MAKEQIEAAAGTGPRPQARAPVGLQMFRALAHRDFRYLQAGNQASQLGFWVQQMGSGWLVYELTKSPFQLGLVTFFSGGAMIALTPVGGTLVDRLDRRRILLVTQALVAIIAVALAVLVLFQRIELWHMYVAAVLSGGLSAIVQPARQALVYDLVGREDLPNAIALNAVTLNAARVVGPSLGGALLATTGVQGTFFFQAGCLAFAVWATMVIREGRRSEPIGEKTSFVEAMVTGIRYCMKDRTIAVLLLMSMVAAVLGWPYITLMPAYAAEVLHAGSGGYGLLMAAVGVGAVIGSVFVAFLSAVPWKGKLLVAAMVLNGLALVALGIPSVLAISLVILAGIGLAGAIQMAMNQILVQLKVDDQYRGRLSALYFLGFGLQPIGALPAGAIAESWGVPAGILVLGVAMTLAVGLIVLLNRKVIAL